MQIKSIKIAKFAIPLIRPFITAVRKTYNVEDIVVMIETTDGKIGYGSAAATPAITGETSESIIAISNNIIAPKLIGHNLKNFNELLNLVQNSCQNNNSAKAAIDIALHDLFAQKCNLPLYELLGGGNNTIKTSITISAKDIESMQEDIKDLLSQGFDIFKIKLGLDPDNDLDRIIAISNILSNKATFAIDANQGWNCKLALQLIKTINSKNIPVAFIEQPVKKDDLISLKKIKDTTSTIIVADEACFTPNDALKIVKQEIADAINIKFMKCGGIQNAKSIYQIAKTANLDIMLGCMLESPIGVNAIASFAISRSNILLADLDPIALIKSNPVIGGATIKQNQITLSDKPGLGIEGFNQNLDIVANIS